MARQRQRRRESRNASGQNDPHIVTSGRSAILNVMTAGHSLKIDETVAVNRSRKRFRPNHVNRRGPPPYLLAARKEWRALPRLRWRKLSLQRKRSRPLRKLIPTPRFSHPS